MKNELYKSLIKYIAEHGYKISDAGSTKNSAIDASHAVISHLYSPERCFVFLFDKSFLIRKYDDDFTKTRNSR